MTELRLLADEVGVSERTLRRAVNEGALHASRPTPRTLELPLPELRFVRRSWSLLAALRASLRTERNVRFAMLFGSTAAGTDAPTSDVDLLVDLRDPSLERMVDLSSKLAAEAGRPVEVVRLEDVEDDPLLLADLLVGGRVLVDREGLWPRLRRRERALRRRGREQEAERTRSALAGIDRLLGS